MKQWLIRFSAVLMAALALTVCAALPVQAAYDDYDTYSYDVQRPPVNWVKVGGISLLISIVVTGAVVVMIYHGYKHNGKTEPYPYDSKAPLELTDTEDILVDTDIQRERIQREPR